MTKKKNRGRKRKKQNQQQIVKKQIPTAATLNHHYPLNHDKVSSASGGRGPDRDIQVTKTADNQSSSKIKLKRKKKTRNLEELEDGEEIDDEEEEGEDIEDGEENDFSDWSDGEIKDDDECEETTTQLRGDSRADNIAIDKDGSRCPSTSTSTSGRVTSVSKSRTTCHNDDDTRDNLSTRKKSFRRQPGQDGDNSDLDSISDGELLMADLDEMMGKGEGERLSPHPSTIPGDSQSNQLRNGDGKGGGEGGGDSITNGCVPTKNPPLTSDQPIDDSYQRGRKGGTPSSTVNATFLNEEKSSPLLADPLSIDWRSLIGRETKDTPSKSDLEEVSIEKLPLHKPILPEQSSSDQPFNPVDILIEEGVSIHLMGTLTSRKLIDFLSSVEKKSQDILAVSYGGISLCDEDEKNTNNNVKKEKKIPQEKQEMERMMDTNDPTNEPVDDLLSLNRRSSRKDKEEEGFKIEKGDGATEKQVDGKGEVTGEAPSFSSSSASLSNSDLKVGGKVEDNEEVCKTMEDDEDPNEGSDGKCDNTFGNANNNKEKEMEKVSHLTHHSPSISLEKEVKISQLLHPVSCLHNFLWRRQQSQQDHFREGGNSMSPSKFSGDVDSKERHEALEESTTLSCQSLSSRDDREWRSRLSSSSSIRHDDKDIIKEKEEFTIERHLLLLPPP